MKRLNAISVLIGLFVAGTAAAQLTAPELYKNVGFDQRLGENVPLDLAFRDDAGQEVRLGRYFGEKPVILALVYYKCPMLCTLVLNGLLKSLRYVAFDVGKEFDVVLVSFNPNETAVHASAKKIETLRHYARPGTADGWHFLTGDAESIRKLADAVGFRYAYDPVAKEYDHASGILVLTPSGQIARLFYGIEYLPKDVRLGLVEASAGRIGSVVDHLILLCYRYDPANGRYGLVILSIVRLAGLATVILLGSTVLLLLRRERLKSGI